MRMRAHGLTILLVGAEARVSVSIHFMPAQERVAGWVGNGRDARPFRSWLDLLTLIEAARSAPNGAAPDPRGRQPDLGAGEGSDG